MSPRVAARLLLLAALFGTGSALGATLGGGVRAVVWVPLAVCGLAGAWWWFVGTRRGAR